MRLSTVMIAYLGVKEESSCISQHKLISIGLTRGCLVVFCMEGVANKPIKPFQERSTEILFYLIFPAYKRQLN